MGLEVHPMDVEAVEALEALEDPILLVLHTSDATLPLPASCQGPSSEGARHVDDPPSLGAP